MNREEFKKIVREFVSTDRYIEHLIDRPDIVMLLKDLEGGIVYANETICRMLEAAPGDVIGKPVTDHWPKEKADEYEKDDLDVVESGEQRLGYIESGGDKVATVLMSDKGPIEVDGEPHVLVISQDLEEFKNHVRKSMINSDVGRVFLEEETRQMTERVDNLMKVVEELKSRSTARFDKLTNGIAQ